MDRFGHARFQMPSPERLFTPMVTVLLGLSVAGFVLSLLAPAFVQAWFMMDPYLVVRGRVWQVLTYPFFTTNPWVLVLDGILIMVLGGAIEREWRGMSLLGLWLVTTVLCALIWIVTCLLTGSRYPMFGLGAGAFGMVGAFGLVFRERRFLWFLVAMNSQTLAFVLIGIGVIFSLPRPITLISILGAPIAYGYVQLVWHLSSSQESVVTSGGDYHPGGFVDLD